MPILSLTLFLGGCQTFLQNGQGMLSFADVELAPGKCIPPESASHNEMHNLVCRRISDVKDKLAVNVGI